jgi:TIR domain/Prokaryotic STING domain
MTAQTKRSRKIFFSYRRADNFDFVERIRDRFIEIYGVENVFMDVDSIPAGAKFADKIHAMVQNCDAMIAIIGPSWLEVLQQKAARFEEDYVRTEIKLALEAGKYIVPICIKGASVPTKDDHIPTDIREMFDYQVEFLDSSVFRDRMPKLVETVEHALAEREQQHQEIQELDRLFPAPGLALTYYVNFVQAIMYRISDPTSAIEIKDRTPDSEAVQIDSQARLQLQLNIILPVNLSVLDRLIKITANTLMTATIQTASRPLLVQARRVEDRYQLIDIPKTISVIELWIKRRMNEMGDAESELAVRFERDEIERFELMLQWWIRTETGDAKLKQLVRIIRYDPENVLPELEWLHRLSQA